MKKKLTLNRGYSAVHEKITKNNRLMRSCYNCDSYYQASGDKEECCQNSNVTKYDLVVTDNNICCSYWKPLQIKVQKRGPKTVKELFMQRKSGGK